MWYVQVEGETIYEMASILMLAHCMTGIFSLSFNVDNNPHYSQENLCLSTDFETDRGLSLLLKY